MKMPFKIMIGFSDADQANRIKDILSTDFEVIISETGEDVYKKVHSEQPNLAILDYSLSGFNPIEIHEGVNWLHPETVFVLCVDDENLEVARRVWCRRAIDYLRKPISEKHILDDVKKIVRYIVLENQRELLKGRIKELETELATLKGNTDQEEEVSDET